MNHTDRDHLIAFRSLIKSLQSMANDLAITGAVGPLLAFDAVQQTGVRRFRFASVSGQNDRILVSEILSAMRSCSHSTPVSFALLRTQLVRPQPGLQIRATVTAWSVAASLELWSSHALITDAESPDPLWVAINDDRLANLVNPVIAYVRFCHAQGVAYS